MHPKHLSIADYTYHLPAERIALYPLPERDASKLLLYRNGQIQEDIYRNIANHLTPGSLLVFNNTKVIQARLLFQKPTGGVIEIFCLEPYEPGINEFNVIMAATGTLRWKCMIGGASKWKEGPLQATKTVNGQELTMQAQLVERLPDAYVVELSWTPPQFSFAEVLGLFGDMPLPPYIKRKLQLSDKERYQTIYAEQDGSVAAPTAGLHFTQHVFDELEKMHCKRTNVTLHVGAGTFKPVKAPLMQEHEMHNEWIDVNLGTIDDLIAHTAGTVIAVGTTSLRTIESLYWMGVKIWLQPTISFEDLAVSQWEVYEDKMMNAGIDAKTALETLKGWMQENSCSRLLTHTGILIAPGYRYRVARAIITNFHQPQSTLLLLVAAAVGEQWKNIYQYAMDHDFRFLSYGDGSLLYTQEA